MKTRLQVEELEGRIVPYVISGYVWPLATAANLSVSFVPDGTLLDTGYANNLFANMDAKFARADWQGTYAGALAKWESVTNVNFHFVPDPGLIQLSGSLRHDAYLGYTYYPTVGDYNLNTGYNWFLDHTTYSLQHGALHELGHSLGLDHSVANTVMYNTYQQIFELTADDIAGVQAMYGVRTPDAYDRIASNDSLPTASVVPPNTTVVGDLTTRTDADFYRFTSWAGGTTTIVLNAKDFSLLIPTMIVYNQLGTALSVQAATTYGATLTFSLNAVAGQSYTVAVGGATADAFHVGAYRLLIDVPPIPPVPTTLDAPTGLTASWAGKSKNLKLSWGAVVGATGYKLYWTDSSGNHGIITTTSPSATVTGPTFGFTTYYVTAVNSVTESVPSKPVVVYPKLSSPVGHLDLFFSTFPGTWNPKWDAWKF